MLIKLDNNLKFLGLIKKSGSLSVGDEAVYSASLSGKARAVFAASDCSPPSKRRAVRYAEDCGAVFAVLPYDKSQLGESVGRREVAMFGVCDTGLASALISKLLTEDSTEEFKDAANTLAKRAERQKSRRAKTGK